MRIFTHSSISPGPSLRQCPTRYAFRAGRNLPDKEFRYLRTVIVTAAVHRGFSSELAPLSLTFRHWAGVSPYTSSCELAETCVFVKQSVGPFHCGRVQPPVCTFDQARRSFFRSYGSILPSSLTRVLPSAWVCSTRLPVSVCGTDTRVSSFRGFSGQSGVNHLWPCGPHPTAQARLADLPTRVIALPVQHRDNQRPAGLPYCVPSSLHLVVQEY